MIRALALLALSLANGPVASRAQDAGLIAAIREEANEIDRNLPAYDRQSKVVLGVSAEGASVDYYRDGEKLRKIAAKIYGERFNSDAEFYFNGDDLLFVHEEFNRYDTQIGMDPPAQVVSSEEKWLYFSAAELVALRIGEKDLSRSDAQWQETGSWIAELVRKLRAASQDE
jgi:hypothetical protein